MGVMKNKHLVTVDIPAFVQDVGETLRARKMTWADLSRATGILDSTLSNLKTRRRVPCLDAYLSICEVLGIGPLAYACPVKTRRARR